VSPRTSRSLYRLVAMLVVLAAAVAIVVFVHDDALRTLAIGLASAAVLALEEFLKNSNDNTAAPSVHAVNAALENQSPNVPPPKVAVGRPTLRIRPPA
jgi:hypothetical protein